MARICFITTLWNSGSTFLCESLVKLDNILIQSEPRNLRWAIYEYLDGNCEFDVVKKLIYGLVFGVDGTRYHNVELVAIKEPALCLIVPDLEKHFPHALFLHLVRDIQDFISSYKEEGWWNDENFAKEFQRILPFSSDFERFIKINEEQRIRLLYGRYNSFNKPNIYYKLKYKDMCIHPKEESKKVCEFLGKDYKFIFEGANTNKIGRHKND